MASIFESYEGEIKDAFRQFDQIVQQFSNLSTEAKPAELDKLEKLLSSIESNLESLNLESNRTGKSTQQYFTQFYTAKKTYQQFKDKYQNEKNYSDLVGPSYRDNFNNQAALGQREKVVKANKTLESGIQMIKMANTQVREDQRVAEATLNNMAQQRERLLGFEKKFDSIDYYIGSARKTIATMSRRAIANKIILAVIILVLIGAIGLIIWLKFRGGDSGGTTDTTTTTTSTTGGPTTSDSTSTSTSTTSTSTSTTGSTIGTSTSTTGGSTSS